MSNQYFDFSVPIFLKSLGGLQNSVEKARALVATLPGGEKEIIEARLASDMFPFGRQVQIACDNAKGAAARLAQVPIPSYDDTESTLDELVARIEKTKAFLSTLTPAQFEETPSVRVELPYFPGKYMTGDDYLKEYALPNFFFHVTTAYDIVRMKGGNIGKADFTNGLPLRENT